MYVTATLLSRRTRARVLNRIVVLMILAVASVVAVPGAAAADSFGPTDDSYVDDGRPTRNYGSRAFLRVDASPLRTSYLKFTVSGVGVEDSAVLKIHAQTSGDDLILHEVADTSWTEGSVTAANAPPVGAVVDTVASIQGGLTYTFDVSSLVTGDGTYSFAVRTSGTTAIRLASSESADSPQLIVPAPPSPSPYLVTDNGDGTYSASSATSGTTHTGTVKYVVETAVQDLVPFDGGAIDFAAGTFDFGSQHLEFHDIANVSFNGAGIGQTILVNNSSAATDTEIFDVVGADNLYIGNMTVKAGGSFRSTSDGLDFDDGNNVTVENVRVDVARGRGIVFDGKGSGWSAENNVVRNCEIVGLPSDGIELLSASNNTIENCLITGVAGHGIQMTKSSGSAAQPNKPSDGNLILGNTIDQSGADGININSGNNNQIDGNIVTNSADVTASRDGIRILSTNLISCDGNEVRNNTSTDTQATKTQRYGLNISSSLCNNTVIGTGNQFGGNLVGDISDKGTNTQYPADTTAPTVPTSVSAVAVSHAQVDVTWSASTDDIGVTGYRVYRDGAFLVDVTGTETSYSDASVLPETTYNYTVDAVDAAGNRSAQSSPPASVTTPAVPSTFTLNPTDDAYVNASSSGTNYGSSSQLRVDGSPDVRSYLLFDVAGITQPITSVTLRIHANSNGNAGVDVSGVPNTSWTEGSITYDDAPPFGSLLGSVVPVSGGSYFEVNLTSHVTGNGTYAFGLSTPGSTAISLSSSEGANPPELVIETSASP